MLGDASRIKQVVTNLLSNAVKFLEASKPVREVLVTVDLVACTESENIIQCTVSDTGPGIKDSDFVLLFNRFSQIDPSLSRCHEGSGLGLAICRSIVSYMKGSLISAKTFGTGTINVRSEYGKGSEFFFIISLAHATAPPPVLVPAAVTIPLHVLVHGTPFTMRLLTRQLGAYGASAAHASSLEEVCQVLNKETVHASDVVILGLNVDDGEMERLTLRLGQMKLLGKPSVVLLNKNRTYSPSITAWLHNAFSAVLFKPCSQRKVLSTVVTVHSHKQNPGENDKASTSGKKRVTPEATKRQRARHILVVEDNKVNQLVAQRLLEQLGHRVEVANDGLQAADLLTKPHTFDLCFMDCQMPRADGYQATQMIRRHQEESHARQLPIVGLTAHALPGDRQKCIDAGMSDYLSKPVKKKQLAEMLDKWT
mmetsp:Transcript_28010/g.45474  ORF Transcript_28010/g.45474 Transcript_28010/m.45474 type:complete len:424 (+) Transcript_28010:385-1656(+)